jgi:PAS domain S-box-containing protein
MDSASAFTATSPAHAGADAVDAGLSDADQWARQRAVILAFSRRSATPTEAEALIRDAAALVAETLQAPIYCSAHLPTDAPTLLLRLARAGGLSAEASLPRSATAASESLAGCALAARQPVICENLAAERRCKDTFLRNQGVVSGLAMPLIVEESSFGAFGVFFPEEHPFNASDIEFAETIGHMLAGTLARLQAENGWRTERQLAASLFQNVDNLVIMTDLHGHVQRINRACEEATGYASHEVRGRQVWSTFAPPEDAQQAHARLREGVTQGGSTVFDLALLTKHAAQRAVRWTQTVLLNDFGQAQSVLVSGTLVPEDGRSGAVNRDAKTHHETEQRELVEQIAAAPFNNPRAGVSQGDGSRGRGTQPFQAIAEPGFDAVRTSPRRAYPYRQLIAAHKPGVSPDRLTFEAVQFHDISAGGVSFRLPYRPAFDTVVLALGVRPNVHYISAKIVSVSEFDEDGGTAYHVGCRFLERLHV